MFQIIQCQNTSKGVISKPTNKRFNNPTVAANVAYEWNNSALMFSTSYIYYVEECDRAA